MNLNFRLTIIFFLISFNCFCQGGYYKEILQEIDKNKVCSRCEGAKYIHSNGMNRTRSHKICGGMGCYDCNYNGTESYKGEPFDYKCGLCYGTGKNPLVSELKNLDSFRKIYLKNHTEWIVLYNAESDGYTQPSYELDYGYGNAEYLIYNEKTKRVFDQWGQPLFDIGYEKDKMVKFIYCGSNFWIDVFRGDVFGEDGFNRRLKRDFVYLAGEDFSGKLGVRGDFNVSVRYNYRNKDPEFPLKLNAVSRVEFNDEFNQIRIIERYIVMLYVSLLYNEAWYNIKGFNNLLNESANGLISNYR